MKRSLKTVTVVGLLLAVFGTIMWLSVPEAHQAPRLNFVGFTNSATAKRMATFSIRNDSPQPILFAPIVEIRTKNGRYERWAAGPPEMRATPLLANTSSTIVTTVPDSGTPWRLRIIWQPKPTKADYVYASTLDRLMRFFRQAEYPKVLFPSARIWQEMTTTPEMLEGQDTEPAGELNARR
jgi:hypothetical protein